MTPSQFWYGDMRLFEAYHKSYLRNTTYQAWVNGMYGRLAVEIGCKNTLAEKESQRINEWVDYKDVTETIYAVKLSAEEIEREHRETLIKQNTWLRDKINDK